MTKTLLPATSTYLGRHAELYDIFYSSKPYDQEAKWVSDTLIRETKKDSLSLLEIACGTGNHSFEFEKLGHKVTPFDYSKDMIQRAAAKAKERNSKLQFHIGDMRDFKVEDAKFDAAVCLFDSIGYVRTDEFVLQSLKNISDGLKPQEGIFVCEFWHAPTMKQHFEPVKRREWNIDKRKIERISKTTVDLENNLATVSWEITEYQSGEKSKPLIEQQVNRFFEIQEMDDLFQKANLKPLRWHAGFSDDTNVNDQTWHIVAVAQRI